MTSSDQLPPRQSEAGSGGAIQRPEAIRYQQQFRRCGKKGCSRCAAGQPGHGPYWYAYWTENGRRRSRYIGKELPPDIEATSPVSRNDSLRVQTLGSFAAHRADQLQTFTSRRAAALFKCLLTAPGYRLTREQAIELLWPEADPDHAATNLRTTVHLLRRTIDAAGSESHLLLEGELLCLMPSGSGSGSDDWLDAEIFERLAKAALAGQDVAACRVALGRYTGDYLPDDPYDVWTEPTRGRLRRLRIELLLHLAQITATQGDLSDAEHCLRAVLAEDAAHEEAAATLMSLLAASSRGSEALRVYRELASALEEELDVAPGADVEALRARIVAQRSGEATPKASVSVPVHQHTNLPAQLTSFVGREWELTEIAGLVHRSRLVTLTGPGGCGKTRLALEVAARLGERYPDGVWLGELAGVSDARLVPAVVASALGVEEQPNILLIDTLCRAWREHDMVLILDNCEHLIDACAELTSRLLSACPRLRILATSREALSVAGEVTYRVPSLATPDPDQPAAPENLAGFEAVALFLDRGRRQRPEFDLTAANTPAVAQICARLDGLPLAIELAAARLSVLPVEGIAQRLDDRFRLLAGGPRTALPRQQTLRATMDWSHSLLQPAEQVLTRRLAVFAGGLTLEAAESICSSNELPTGDILDGLDGLVRKSLIAREEKEGISRYRMLETIRQYAHEKLSQTGEQPELLSRHAAFFADLAERAREALVGPEQLTWMQRLQADVDNLRSAIQWARDSTQIEVGLRLAGPIWRFWMMSGQSSEGRRWLAGLLALDTGANVSDAVRATAVYAAGSLAFVQGDPACAQEHFTRSLKLRRAVGDLKGMAETLNGLGAATVELGAYREATGYYEESIRIRSEIGDAFGQHAPIANLASLAKYHGEYERATELYERALAIQRRFGHVQGVLLSLDNLAQLWGERGDYERAEVLNQEALALARERGIVAIIVTGLGTQGAHSLEQGHLPEAESCLNECLQLCRSVGDRVKENTALINLAEVALGRDDPERATMLAERALAAVRQIGHQRSQAFALMTLSDAARMQGNHERAAALLEECLELRRGMGDALGTIIVVEGRARLALSRGRHEEAVRLYGAATTLRAAVGTPLPPYWRPGQEHDLLALRQSLDGETFEGLWQEGRQAAPEYLPIVRDLTEQVSASMSDTT